MVMNKSRVEISRKVFNCQMSEIWSSVSQKCLNNFKMGLKIHKKGCVETASCGLLEKEEVCLTYWVALLDSCYELLLGT